MASLYKQFTSAIFGKKKTRRHRRHSVPTGMSPMSMGPMGHMGHMPMPRSSGIAIIRIVSKRNSTNKASNKKKSTRKQK